jgi:hypothetical protein
MGAMHTQVEQLCMLTSIANLVGALDKYSKDRMVPTLGSSSSSFFEREREREKESATESERERARERERESDRDAQPHASLYCAL